MRIIVGWTAVILAVAGFAAISQWWDERERKRTAAERSRAKERITRGLGQ